MWLRTKDSDLISLLDGEKNDSSNRDDLRALGLDPKVNGLTAFLKVNEL